MRFRDLLINKRLTGQHLKKLFTLITTISCGVFAADSANAQTTTFSSPGGPYLYTVPAGVTALSVDVSGAMGGYNSSWPSGTYPSEGGNGGRVQAAMAVTPGSVLYIYIGGTGGNGSSGIAGAGGFNGGGAGAVGSGFYGGGGGGGASDIRVGGTAITNRAVVGAGGGGAGLDYAYGNAERGGAGGGLTGGNGLWAGDSTTGAGGYGGTQTGGGAAGSGSGSAGTLGVGGSASAGNASGGGGGGYYGGGSGGSDWAGGGGGSSWANPTMTGAVMMTSGYNTSAGIVSLSVVSAVTFVNGTPQTLAVCGNSTANSIDYLLTAKDGTGGLPLTWSVASGPTHGSLGGFDATATSIASGNVTPSGLTYTPAAGYTGADAFTVQVSDGLNTATTTIAVTVNPLPGIIGTSSICNGSSGTLFSLTPGGSWSSSNTSVVTVASGTGNIMGTGAGVATITYTAPSTGCYSTFTETVNALPAMYSVTGGGGYCAGGTGASVGLSGSETGVSYQLYNGTAMSGTAVAGTGSALSFGMETASGNYTVIATNSSTGCTDTMMSSTTVSVNPLPAQYTISPSASYCSGGAGVNITLSSSDTGVSYQLYSGSTAMGAPVAGTDSMISLGMETAAGSYYVVATNMSTMCADTTGMDTVTINPLPNLYNVTGGGNYCVGGTGVHIGLDGSDTGISYQLYYNVVASGTAVAGTDSAIDFGSQTGAGHYTVLATNNITGCQVSMTGGADVDTVSLVTPSVSITSSAFGPVCAGSNVTFFANPVNGGSTPVYAWYINGSFASDTTNTFSATLADTSTITVMLFSNQMCAVPDTASSTVTVNVLPVATPSVAIAATPSDTVCAGTTITMVATPSYGGDTTFYTWIKNTATVATGPTYSFIPSDSDNVYAIMLSTYACPTSLLSLVAFSPSVYIDVVDPIVPSVTITGRPGLIVGIDKPDTLIATVANGGAHVAYQWYVNNVPVPAATDSVFIRTHNATGDSISCMVTREDACAQTSINSVVLEVKNVGVSELTTGGELALVPNPNKGAFTLKGALATNANEEVNITVMNLLGQVVYSNKFTATGGKIDEAINMENVANGDYLLNISSKSGSSVMRFVVAK